jgi:hypothetical protein
MPGYILSLDSTPPVTETSHSSTHQNLPTVGAKQRLHDRDTHPSFPSTQARTLQLTDDTLQLTAVNLITCKQSHQRPVGLGPAIA